MARDANCTCLEKYFSHLSEEAGSFTPPFIAFCDPSFVDEASVATFLPCLPTCNTKSEAARADSVSSVAPRWLFSQTFADLGPVTAAKAVRDQV